MIGSGSMYMGWDGMGGTTEIGKGQQETVPWEVETHFSVSFNAINSRAPRDICSGLVPSWILIEAVSRYAPLGSRGFDCLLSLLDGRRGRISRSEVLFCVQRWPWR